MNAKLFTKPNELVGLYTTWCQSCLFNVKEIIVFVSHFYYICKDKKYLYSYHAYECILFCFAVKLYKFSISILSHVYNCIYIELTCILNIVMHCIYYSNDDVFSIYAHLLSYTPCYIKGNVQSSLYIGPV